MPQALTNHRYACAPGSGPQRPGGRGSSGGEQRPGYGRVQGKAVNPKTRANPLVGIQKNAVQILRKQYCEHTVAKRQI
eukprot:7714369-Pyramimonas_sp.AAC.4